MKRFFFGADVETDWLIGSPICMRGEYQGKKYEDKGEVLIVDPLQRLRFSHWSPMSGLADTPDNYHVVEFNLVQERNGTRVTLSQANLTHDATPSDLEQRADYEKNWAGVLGGLSKLFPGRV